MICFVLILFEYCGCRIEVVGKRRRYNYVEYWIVSGLYITVAHVAIKEGEKIAST